MILELQIRRETLHRRFKENQAGIKINMNPLEANKMFPYLGLTITYNNSYWAELYINLWTFWRIWGMVEKVLGNTG